MTGKHSHGPASGTERLKPCFSSITNKLLALSVRGHIRSRDSVWHSAFSPWIQMWRQNGAIPTMEKPLQLNTFTISGARFFPVKMQISVRYRFPSATSSSLKVSPSARPLVINSFTFDVWKKPLFYLSLLKIRSLGKEFWVVRCYVSSPFHMSLFWLLACIVGPLLMF